MESLRLRGTQRILRWPLLFFIMAIMFLELVVYLLVRLVVHIWETIMRLIVRNRKLRRKMGQATSFDEWCRQARELDALEKHEKWKEDPISPFYDHQLLQRLMAEVRTYKQKGDMKGLLRILRTIYSKTNVAGLDNEELYSETNFGTKYLIHDFIKEVLEATILLRDTHELDDHTKVEFFRRARRAYGRTALLLSGGAGFGYYHLGVIKTLFEANCLPKVISGTSAGSMIASLIGVRTDEELIQELLQPSVCQFFTACEESFWVQLKRFLHTGALFDSQQWAQKLQLACKGNLTFEEAYKRTGRVLNITTTPMSKYVSPMLLNHITSPHVLIWSAVLASCAVPAVLKPVELLEKDENGLIKPFHFHGSRFSDGSIKHDVPLTAVTEQHNVNYFIVSQVNPHVILFNYEVRGSSGVPSPHRYGSRLRGGFVPATLENLLKLELRKWLQLMSNLDLLPLIFGQDWRYLFLQPSGGTVTISPYPRMRDYFTILSDPSYDEMEQLMILSERNTWPKLSRISNHFIFETTLRSCYEVLRSRLRGGGARRGIARSLSASAASSDAEAEREAPTTAGSHSSSSASAALSSSSASAASGAVVAVAGVGGAAGAATRGSGARTRVPRGSFLTSPDRVENESKQTAPAAAAVIHTHGVASSTPLAAPVATSAISIGRALSASPRDHALLTSDMNGAGTAAAGGSEMVSMSHAAVLGGNSSDDAYEKRLLGDDSLTYMDSEDEFDDAESVTFLEKFQNEAVDRLSVPAPVAPAAGLVKGGGGGVSSPSDADADADADAADVSSVSVTARSHAPSKMDQPKKKQKKRRGRERTKLSNPVRVGSSSI